ncbi:MAG: hypothetical protein J5J00_01395 [Deltaproteobacteria bacterium]|nr:hypothetical protein [Deltaproteobacteria bacterium]
MEDVLTEKPSSYDEYKLVSAGGQQWRIECVEPAGPPGFPSFIVVVNRQLRSYNEVKSDMQMR